MTSAFYTFFNDHLCPAQQQLLILQHVINKRSSLCVPLYSPFRIMSFMSSFHPVSLQTQRSGITSKNSPKLQLSLRRTCFSWRMVPHIPGFTFDQRRASIFPWNTRASSVTTPWPFRYNIDKWYIHVVRTAQISKLLSRWISSVLIPFWWICLRTNKRSKHRYIYRNTRWF